MSLVWADVFLVLLVGLLSWGGYKRGIIPELFDLLALIGSLTATLRLYGPLGAALLGSLLKAFSEPWAYGIAFVLICVPSALLIFMLGLHLDRVTKDRDRIPEPVRIWVGLAVGFFKSILVGCLFVGLYGASPNMLDRDRVAFRTAPVVQLFRGFSPRFQPLVEVMAPKDLARRYRRAIEANFPEPLR